MKLFVRTEHRRFLSVEIWTDLDLSLEVFLDFSFIYNAGAIIIA